MSRCRICQNSVPQYQTFCSHCGARQTVTSSRGIARKNVFSRLKDSFMEGFRSEAEKRFESACKLLVYGYVPAIQDLEEVVNLNPRNTTYRDTLRAVYLGAGDERLSHPFGFPGGPLGELRSGTFGEIKAKEILSWVSKVRQLKGKELLPYIEAYEGLNKALNGSLEMFDKSLDMDPTYSDGYSGRAGAFHKVADGILMAYGIFPVRFLTHSVNELKGKLVQYGNAQLGICLEQEMPDLEFAVEILWLYEQAVEDYQEALRLDSTDAESYIGLSQVLRQLGKGNKATNNLNKALAILNKAIQADNGDEQSYSERAEVFEELGEVEPAISDLERLLTVSTSEFELGRTRRKIEELRKVKRQERKNESGRLAKVLHSACFRLP